MTDTLPSALSYGLYVFHAASAAAVAVVVGECTLALAYWVQRSHLLSLRKQVAEFERLSKAAADQADPATYRAVNREGNEAYGKLFFFKVSLSAAALWPIFFALQWLQKRYAGVDLPLPGLGFGLNYVVLFLLSYIPLRILFSRITPKLPGFRKVHEILHRDADELGSDLAR
ncbi:hypothetical protein [Desulfacinum infernum]|nr:hypothetical protein [Desulfacinum infernum]